MVWGCSSGAGLGPLVPVKGTLDASADQDILDNSISQLCGTSLELDLPLQHDCGPEHKEGP